MRRARRGRACRAEGARQRVLRAGPHEGGGAEEDPRLRSAERLVPREADEVGSLGERLGGNRLVAEARLGEPLRRARTGVEEERDSRLPAERRELSERDLFREPDDPVVRRPHLQDRRGPRADGLGVVLGRRLVRRPDLQERGPAPGEDRRDAEVAPDRDELASRDGDGAAVGNGVEGEEERGGGVRDGQGVEVLAARGEQLEEEGPHVLAPIPAPAGRQVELERGVAARAENGFPRRDGERRPAEIRVEKDPRGVDDGPRTGGRAGREGGPGRAEDRAGGVSSGAEAPPPEPVGCLAKGLPRPQAPMPGGEREPPLVRQELLDGRRDGRGGCQDP